MLRLFLIEVSPAVATAFATVIDFRIASASPFSLLLIEIFPNARYCYFIISSCIISHFFITPRFVERLSSTLSVTPAWHFITISRLIIHAMPPTPAGFR